MMSRNLPALVKRGQHPKGEATRTSLALTRRTKKTFHAYVEDHDTIDVLNRRRIDAIKARVILDVVSAIFEENPRR